MINPHEVLIQIQSDTKYLRMSMDRLHDKIIQQEDRLRIIEQDNARTQQVLKGIVGISAFIAVSGITLIAVIL